MAVYKKSDYENANTICVNSFDSVIKGLDNLTNAVTLLAEESKGKFEGRASDTIIARIKINAEMFSFISDKIKKAIIQIRFANTNVIRKFGDKYPIIDEKSVDLLNDYLNQAKNTLSRLISKENSLNTKNLINNDSLMKLAAQEQENIKERVNIGWEITKTNSDIKRLTDEIEEFNEVFNRIKNADVNMASNFDDNINVANYISDNLYFK